jgi:uncharacterized protein
VRRPVWALGVVSAGALAWGAFEAQWLRLRRLDLAVRGLPAALDGLRILHLSDLHLGTFSQNARTLRKAVEWPEARDVDLLVLTGDLLSRRRGEAALEEALERIRPRYGTYAVLGNHEVDDSRDPFSEPVSLERLEDGGAILLENEAHSLEIRGACVQIVGCSPSRRELPPVGLADRNAHFRVLLTHFPDAFDYLPDGAFQLVLAGHMHGGQICVPLPGGRRRLLNVFDPYLDGLYVRGSTPMYVTSGVGTTLVPFRFFARPEAALLVLRGAN